MQILEQSKIPEELMQFDKWVMWKLVYVIDKKTGEIKIDPKTGEPETTKVPYQINGKEAKSNDSSTWTSYSRAINALPGRDFTGIGFILTDDDPYTVIDLDDCITDGKLIAEHARIANALNSYTEYSYSGTGLHIFVKAKKSGKRSKDPRKVMEIYDDKRFIVMTGNHVEGSPLEIEERQNELTKIYNHYFPKKEETKKPITTSLAMEDEDILSIAFKAKNGDVVKRLYEGDVSMHDDDDSSADLALCNYLAFYTQDIGQIDRIFRSSKLYRPKWDEMRGEKTYGEMTIDKAVSGLRITYQKKGYDYPLNFKVDDEPFLIPQPFLQKDGNLYKSVIVGSGKNGEEVDEFISRQIPYLTKEFRNIESSEVFYELFWQDRKIPFSKVVQASTIAVKKELLELSNQGFSVNEINVRDIINFFHKYLQVNELEQQYAVERLGKVKEKFIHPILTSEIEIMAAGHGEEQTKNAFEIKGTSDSWRTEIFERIKDQPKAVFMILSSFASVIIQDLGIKPFIVEVSGGTSQGKTTVLEISSSVWGNKHLVNEWNATPVGIERKAAYLNSYPLLMDDTRKASKSTLDSIVYHFSGGRSKGRGSIKGSQKEYTWNNILLSTGEVSLNDYGEDKGGIAARVIPLGDEPLKQNYENVIHLQEAMDKNYGAIGVDFLKSWFKNKDKSVKEFQEIKKLYVSKAGANNVLSRLAEFYATVHFTGMFLIEHLQLDVNLEDLVIMFENIKEENKDVDKPMKFLEDILTDLDSKRDYIASIQPAEYQVKAIYKDNQLYLLPAYTKEFLGVEERPTRKAWLKRGITIGCEQNGELVDYTRVRYDGKRSRAIPLNMEYVNRFGFDFEENREIHRDEWDK